MYQKFAKPAKYLNRGAQVVLLCLVSFVGGFIVGHGTPPADPAIIAHIQAKTGGAK